MSRSGLEDPATFFAVVSVAFVDRVVSGLVGEGALGGGFVACGLGAAYLVKSFATFVCEGCLVCPSLGLGLAGCDPDISRLAICLVTAPIEAIGG